MVDVSSLASAVVIRAGQEMIVEQPFAQQYLSWISQNLVNLISWCQKCKMDRTCWYVPIMEFVFHQEGVNVPRAGQAKTALYQHVEGYPLWMVAVVNMEPAQHQSSALVMRDGPTREATASVIPHSVLYHVHMVVLVLGPVCVAVQCNGLDIGVLCLAALVLQLQKELAADMASVLHQTHAHAVLAGLVIDVQLLCVVGMKQVQRMSVVDTEHVVHQKAAPVMLDGRVKIAPSLFVMDAQSMGHAPSQANVNVLQAGLLQAVTSQCVIARMVGSVLHLTLVSAQQNGKGINVHWLNAMG